jgi:hypothetical protein
MEGHIFNKVSLILTTARLWGSTAAASELKLRFLSRLIRSRGARIRPLRLVASALWPLGDGFLPAGTIVGVMARKTRRNQFQLFGGFETNVWLSKPPRPKGEYKEAVRYVGRNDGEKIYLVQCQLVSDYVWESPRTALRVHVAWEGEQSPTEISREVVFGWF